MVNFIIKVSFHYYYDNNNNIDHPFDTHNHIYGNYIFLYESIKKMHQPSA